MLCLTESFLHYRARKALYNHAMTEEGGGLHQHTSQSAPGLRWSMVSKNGEPASPPGREALTVRMDMSGLLKRSSGKEAAEATPPLNQEGPRIQLLSACLAGCIF